MMRLLVICGLIFGAIAAPVKDDEEAKILSYVNESDGKGNYDFSFETSNGISRDESGTVMNEGKPDQYIYVRGSFSYTDPDGKIQTFSYVADNNGYEMDPLGGIIEAPEVPPSAVASLFG